MERLVRCEKCGRVAPIDAVVCEDYREGNKYYVVCACEECNNEFIKVYDLVYSHDVDRLSGEQYDTTFNYCKAQDELAYFIDKFSDRIDTNPNMREAFAEYCGEGEEAEKRIEEIKEKYGKEYLGLLAMVYYYNSDYVEDILRGY